METRDEVSTDNIWNYVKTYKYDLRSIYEAVSGLTSWQKHGWYNASSGTTSSYDDKELDIRHIVDNDELLAACSKIMHEAAMRYANELMPYATITAISHPRLNRYESGAMMRIHSDHIHSLFDGDRKGIPVLSILAMINDNFQGGDFILCGKKNPLAAGDVIVFPSNFMYPHEVAEVTSGTRYSMVSWAW